MKAPQPKPLSWVIPDTHTEVAGLDEGSLVLERRDETTDAAQDAACGPYDRHPDEHWLAVPVRHLSRFALFGRYSVFLPLVLRNHQSRPQSVCARVGTGLDSVAIGSAWECRCSRGLSTRSRIASYFNA